MNLLSSMNVYGYNLRGQCEHYSLGLTRLALSVAIDCRLLANEY
jgi:hypothetical protein